MNRAPSSCSNRRRSQYILLESDTQAQIQSIIQGNSLRADSAPCNLAVRGMDTWLQFLNTMKERQCMIMSGHEVCCNFPIRCDCSHTQQRCALQRFIASPYQGSTALRLGYPVSHVGDAQTLQSSMELKLRILTLPPALWTEQDH